MLVASHRCFIFDHAVGQGTPNVHRGTNRECESHCKTQQEEIPMASGRSFKIRAHAHMNTKCCLNMCCNAIKKLKILLWTSVGNASGVTQLIYFRLCYPARHTECAHQHKWGMQILLQMQWDIVVGSGLWVILHTECAHGANREWKSCCKMQQEEILIASHS